MRGAPSLQDAQGIVASEVENVTEKILHKPPPTLFYFRYYVNMPPPYIRINRLGAHAPTDDNILDPRLVAKLVALIGKTNYAISFGSPQKSFK